MIQGCRRWLQKPGVLFMLIAFYAGFQATKIHQQLEQKDGSSHPGIAADLKDLSGFAMQNDQIINKNNQKKLGNLTLDPGPIFYNIFVPAGNFSNTRRILVEQFEQVQTFSPGSEIWYTWIGDNDSLLNQIQSICKPYCKLHKLLKQGDEICTLQSLWEYCQAQDLDSSRDVLVTYIHDKGSFHPTSHNEKSRKLGTKAALTCRNQMIESKNPRQCTICTGAFHVFPQYLASSNMWTARCSYMKHLKAPKEYGSILQSMYDTTLNHSELRYSKKYACLYPGHIAPNYWGVGRYSLERWPLSHPEVRPCNVIPGGEGKYDTGDEPWEPQLRKAPQSSARASGITTGPYKSSFARLAGRLFEWDYVYHQAPPENSWVWKWYRGYEEGTKQFLERCQASIAQ